MAQNAPTLASSRRSNDEGPQYMRAEAVAMRRLVAARGWWLSPQFATVPIPVLTEWEASVELANVDHNHTTRERQQAKNLLKNRSQYQSHKRSQQSTAENVLATIDTAPRHKGDRHRNYATPTVLDITIKRATKPWSLDTLQARKAHRDTIEEVAQAQGKSPVEVEREVALARVTALAAEKAAAHVTAEARAARRLELTRKAQAKYTAGVNANPARAAAKREEKNRRERERKAQQRAAARSGADACPSIVAEVVDAAEAKAFRMKRKQGKKADAQQPQEGAARFAGRPIPNPHRDPTIPTAKMLREEAIRAEAIEAEERRLLAVMKREGRRVTSERNLHPPK